MRQAPVVPPPSVPPVAPAQGRGGTSRLLEDQRPGASRTEGRCPPSYGVGSRSNNSAVAAAVHPWAKSRMARHRSLSRGVGARITRRYTSFTPDSHCSSDRPISLTPIIPSTNWPPSGLSFAPYSTPSVCAFHLGFGLAVQQGWSDGYRDLSLMRASWVVKRQSARTASRFRWSCQARVSLPNSS